jgi:hypothetical protein
MVCLSLGCYDDGNKNNYANKTFYRGLTMQKDQIDDCL